MATAAAVTGVTRRRRSRPISRCCTSGSATPKSDPDISVVVSRPGISTAITRASPRAITKPKSRRKPSGNAIIQKMRGAGAAKLDELGADEREHAAHEHVNSPIGRRSRTRVGGAAP